MTERIPMSLPDTDESDAAAVAAVVRSGRLALGPHAEAFERGIADYVGAEHAVALSSGTAALHLALRGLGIGPGDEVLVPSFTFAASANAIAMQGATPVFVDIEADTLNVCADDAARHVTPRTRAIMVVDVFGHPVEQDAIERLAREHRLLVVDDACEALGARYRDRPVGSFGDAATFGFYPNKQITTGEGGMLVTDDAELAQTARSLRNQGRARMGAWLEHERIGFNYRLDEMSAALGASQLRRIDALLAARTRVAERYGLRLGRFDGVELPRARPHCRVSWFVFVVRLARGVDRDQVIERLAELGIPSRVYFPPLHLQSYTRAFARIPAGGLPVTESIADRTLALPFHGALTDEQIDEVAETLKRIVERIG